MTDYARSQPPQTKQLTTYYMILTARTHHGLVHHRSHAALPNDPRNLTPGEQDEFMAFLIHKAGLAPGDLVDDPAGCARLGIWDDEDACHAAYRQIVEDTGASPIRDRGPLEGGADASGRFGRSF